MKRLVVLVSLLTVALFVFSSPAFAANHGQAGHAAHGAAAGHGEPGAAMKQVVTSAEVLAVAPDGSSLEIDHPPIPALGWPAMQMSLSLEKPELAEGIGAGDRVQVAIRQLSATEYVITEVTKE
ncbi:copper-binding protein [Desulfofustis limnaeus]|uniref:Copper-binding protein n=1 Tax=Desulfofustis limnaeus TaxID=2740163 RepID=A0ABM7W7K0_9BACT|nr:copper-binding protein [Desulfofustis limnaeus]BDD86855.1 hypothetical protein DPPLL_12200 [Desulfofustis limnaeus]